MTVARLVQLLDGSDLEFRVEDVLDALWLASLGVNLQSATGEKLRQAPKQDSPTVRPEGATERTDGGREPPVEKPATPDPERSETPVDAPSADTLLYAGGPVSAEDRTISASGIIAPAARTLPRRLELQRALRPLRQKWPSAAVAELDEEATVELTASMVQAGRRTIFPVMRPKLERWFECDLVLEADDAVEIWRDPLRDFAATLRDSGAFREVRSWRLRLPAEGAAGDLASARLEAPAGGRIPARRLSGGIRRLILFATHGASDRWLDGSYSRLLAGWAQDANVAVLHLLPGDMWLRTALGEPQGVCTTSRPGALAPALDVNVHWWMRALDPDSMDTFRLPVLELRPEAVERWAAMVMARGRQSPLFLLDARPSERARAAAGEKASIADRVDALREGSPEAFRLAITLSVSPFTIPVAHLVQEATFGAVDNRRLAELFLSGLIRSLPAPAGMPAASDSWYVVAEDAQPLLRRSLRGEESGQLAGQIFERVSSHLSAITGRQVSLQSFTPDENGKYQIPDWAHPFARLAHSLRALGPKSTEAEPTFERLRRSISARSLGILARASVHGHAGLLDRIDPDEREMARHVGAVREEESGIQFDEAVRGRFADLDLATPLFGLRILWVDDVPANNVEYVPVFTGLGATVLEVLTTDAAVQAMANPIDLVISDMGRGDEERAGLQLLALFGERWPEIPVIIFAGGFAASPDRRTGAVQAGAFGCTNNALELRELLIAAARGEGPPTVEEEAASETGESTEENLSPQAYERRGHEALDRGDFDLAARSFAMLLNASDQATPFRAYLALGLVAARRGQHDEARHWYQEGLEYAQDLGNEYYIEESHSQLGDLASTEGRLDEAKSHYEQALAHARNTKSGEGIPRGYYKLAALAVAMGKLEEALRLFHQVVESEGSSPQDFTAGAWEGLGGVARLQGKPAEAGEFYLRLVRLGEERGKPTWTAGGFRGLGDVEASNRNWDGARDWYSQYARVAEASADQMEIMTAYSRLGSVSELSGDFERALQEYRHALAVAETINHRPAVAEAHLQIGSTAARAGHTDLATLHLQQAVTDFEELRDLRGLAQAQLQFGDAMRDRRDHLGAQRRYELSLKVARTTDNPDLIVSATTRLAQLAEGDGDIKTAERWYREALRYQEKRGDQRGAAENCVDLGRLFARSGRDREASDMLRKAQGIFQRLKDGPGLEDVLLELGQMEARRSRLGAARELYEQAQKSARDRGDLSVAKRVEEMIRVLDASPSS